MWKKYCRAGEATDGNMALARCMLHTESYKHTLRICNAAFPLQRWLRESASLLLHTYIAWLATDL